MSVTIRLQYLPLSASASDIRAFFSGLRIPDGAVHIVGGEDGDAFIGFASDEDARQAMARNGGKIHGTEIRLLLSSRTEMNDVIARVKSGKSRPSQATAASTTESNNLWNPDISQQNKPAYARISQKPENTEPSYNRAPPSTNQNAPVYQGSYKEPTYPPFNPPIGRQPTVRQMNYGDTDTVYEASPAYSSPVYQQSPAIQQKEVDSKPYTYTATEERKSEQRQAPIPPLSREAEEAIGKLPPHLRPPHGIPPPHLRHLFPNLQHNGAANEQPPRDPAPRREEPTRQYIASENRDSRYRDLPSRHPQERYPDHHAQDRFPDRGLPPPQREIPQWDRYPEREQPPPRDFPPSNESWRSERRDNGPWDPRPAPFDVRNDVGRRPHIGEFHERRDHGPPPRHYGSELGGHGHRGGHHNGDFGRTLAAQNAQKYLEICRLPNDLLRPVALEAFLKPSIPFTVSSVKVVYNPQGIHLATLLRVENEADFTRIMSRDGDQGIKVRPTTRIQFEEAVDGIPATAPRYMRPDMDRRPNSKDKERPPSRGSDRPSSRAGERDRKRRSRTRSPVRRKKNSRSRSPRRRRGQRSRSPQPIRRTGRQDPNRWCLMLTNVPFKIEPEEIMAWLSERVRPMKLTRTYYADGNASDRWVAEFESESTMERAKHHRTLLNNRSVKMTYIDNDYADEIMAIEDKYGEIRKKEYDMKQLAELQLQHLNGTLGPHGVPRFFNNPASSCPQVQQQHYNQHFGTNRQNGLPVEHPTNGSSHAGGLLGNNPAGGSPYKGGRGGYFGGPRGRGRGMGPGSYSGPPGFGRRHNSSNFDSEKSDPRSEKSDPRSESSDRDMFATLGPSGTVIACHGFPSDVTLPDILDFFANYPVDESSVKIKLADDGRGTGDAVLCIPHSEKAEAAVIELNGRELRGSTVNLELPAY